MGSTVGYKLLLTEPGKRTKSLDYEKFLYPRHAIEFVRNNTWSDVPNGSIIKVASVYNKDGKELKGITLSLRWVVNNGIAINKPYSTQEFIENKIKQPLSPEVERFLGSERGRERRNLKNQGLNLTSDLTPSNETRRETIHPVSNDYPEDAEEWYTRHDHKNTPSNLNN